MIISADRIRSIRKSAAQLKKNKVVLAGLAFAVFISLVAIIAPFVVPSKELTLVNFSGDLRPPSAAHWFGTDTVGRDLLQVMVAATSYDLFGTAIILLISSVIGIGLGALAGYVGGKVDELIMRVTDIFLALPALVLALAVAAVLGRTFPNLILAISFVWWSPICRIMRGQALSERNKPYVDTLVVFGVPRRRIILNHIIPNSIFPVFVYITTQVGFLILVFAGLNYIGFGPGPLTPEWGQLIANGQEYIFQDPTLIIFPGLAIFLTSMAFNLLGDGLRDVFDPRLRR